MAEQYPALHAYTHLPEGSDPLPGPADYEWQDIRSNVNVTRISGGDSNPDIVVSLAQAITIGQLVGGLTVIQLLLAIGSGGAGSGTSGYIVNGVGLGFPASYMAGTGMFYQGSGAALYRSSIRSQAGAEMTLQWDGAAGLIPVGPKASTGGGPFDFAVGDFLFDGQIIVPVF